VKQWRDEEGNEEKAGDRPMTRLGLSGLKISSLGLGLDESEEEEEEEGKKEGEAFENESIRDKRM
jgi:hypothetical protein